MRNFIFNLAAILVLCISAATAFGKVETANAVSHPTNLSAMDCPTQGQAIEQLAALLGVSTASVNAAISEAKITVDALACGWRFTAENGTYWGDLFKASGGGGSGTVTQIDIVDPW